MNKNYFCLLLILLLETVNLTFAQDAPPPTLKQPVIDEYFGVKVTDHYRWLENVDAHEVKDWFKMQSDYSNKLLDRIPGRDSLIATLASYDKLLPVRYSDVMRRAGRYFFRKTLPGENVSKLCYKDGEKGSETLILDPQRYGKDKKYAIANYVPSEDGKMLAIALSSEGGEIFFIRVYDMVTRSFLPDSIAPVIEDITWTPDNKGIIYTKLNSTNPFDANYQTNTVSFYHALGTAQANDPILLSNSKYPDLNISETEIPIVYYTNDHRYLIGHLATVDLRMHLLIAPASDLLKPRISWRPLIIREDSVSNIAAIQGRLFVHSIKGAPNGQVLVTDLDKPDIRSATVVVPEGKKIYTIGQGKDYLLITKDDVVRSYLQTYQVNTGKLKEVTPPIPGIYGFAAYDPNANDFYVAITSWLQPLTVYNYDADKTTIKSSPFSVAAKYPGLSDLTVEEVEVPGHDGVQIPLTIIYRKNLKKDGSAICFMTGYGAYGSSATPRLDTRYLALLNKGVVVAVTHPRGGSEKGLSWYKAGFKTTKPNTWKDFISSGEYLIRNGYTSASHLIGEGTSAGGILIGRAITERPDLFAAAINNVGATNILRFELTPNPDNIAEFGTFKDSIEFRGLLEMDALNHVEQSIKYPAVINIGGMNDPRVIIWQPGKFA
ncbi:MAG: prolyl oligopeptidase family serine peptidase, partial [Chitinophagaceae bacterium]|nr:prolyl oligopeptidase family serine peptidase [Chitinophagaceae bacterium]